MKRSLISLSLAAFATASIASAEPGTSNEEGALDRTLPTYPELGFDKFDQTPIAEGKYVIDAGESSHDAVAKDVG